MYYLLFLLYLSLCGYIVTSNSLVKKTGLDTKTIAGLFLLKVFAGLALGWITNTYYPGASDYWANNILAWGEYQVLVRDPKHFITGITSSGYGNYNDFFGSVNSYWNDLKLNIVIKFIALFDLFSRGNYYINSLFFSSIAFIGHVALYRIFHHIYPSKKWQAIVGCFLLPSALYFASGLNKDPLIFMLLSIYCYCLYFSIMQKSSAKKIVIMIMCGLIMLVLRSYISFLLLPCSLAFFICRRFKIRPWASFASIYTGCIVLLFVLQITMPGFQPLKAITQKQDAFFQQRVAKSQLATDTIAPSVQSFIVNTPQALSHSFLHPYPFEFSSPAINLLSLEMIFYFLLMILLFFFYDKSTGKTDPFVFFSLTMGFSALLLIGYIVPNAGSIVRYRSLFLPLLITPLLCTISFKRPNINF